jgi:TonB family protein
MTRTLSIPDVVRRSLGLSFLVILWLCTTATFAQEPCKSKGEVRASYPELAKRMKIAGSVRLELMLDKGGAVRDVKVLGGNPVLVSAATEAVKHSKFENPEPCVITFDFKE